MKRLELIINGLKRGGQATVWLSLRRHCDELGDGKRDPRKEAQENGIIELAVWILAEAASCFIQGPSSGWSPSCVLLPCHCERP